MYDMTFLFIFGVITLRVSPHPRNEPYLLEYYVIEYMSFLARGSELVMLEPRQHLISSQQRLLPLYTISFIAGYTVPLEQTPKLTTAIMASKLVIALLVTGVRFPRPRTDKGFRN